MNLNGYFSEGRQNVFASHPAPIQINYLGFPGILGAEYMDYLIADSTVIPPNSREYYVEKLPTCQIVIRQMIRSASLLKSNLQE